ncbi:MAG: thioredoxin family protein [bacterium]
MKIEIIEIGCPTCKMLLERTKQAIDELGLPEHIEEISDISEMMKYGITSLPALIIDGVVMSEGKIPKIEEIKDFIKIYQKGE